MKNWRTLSRETVLDAGKFLKVEMHKVEFDDGTLIDDWPWVVAPDYVNIVTETHEGTYIVFRQQKYALEEAAYSIVGGYVERGEDPALAARRELMEETGYEAEEWIELGSYVVDANRGFCKGHFYFAKGARRIQDPDANDLEAYEILFLTKDELLQAVTDGRFAVISWAAAVGLALPHIL